MALYQLQIKTQNGMADLNIQAEKALKDGNGDTISSTYVKSVNHEIPDATGNVTINTSGTQPTLLWENGNPPTTAEGVNFPSQTITLSESISNYRYIIITYRSFNNGDFAPRVLKWDRQWGNYMNLMDANGNTAESVIKFRQCYIASNTTIVFNNAYNGRTQDNKQCGPMSIYGTNDL